MNWSNTTILEPANGFFSSPPIHHFGIFHIGTQLPPAAITRFHNQKPDLVKPKFKDHTISYPNENFDKYAGLAVGGLAFYFIYRYYNKK
jgi:hypothetical protein